MRSLILTVLAACSTSTAVAPSPGSGSAAVPLSLAGSYALHSELDLSGLPGPAGAVVQTVVDATNDPDDPGRFLVDSIIATLPAGTIATVLHDAEPVVIAYVNDRLQTLAPQLVARLRAVGAALQRATTAFGTDEELDVPAAGPALHVMHGVRIDGTALAFAEHGIPDATAASVSIALDLYGRMTIGAHQLTLPYGTLLRIALDGAIVPAVDPSAADLYGLLRDSVDCAALGSAISSSLELDAASLFEAACTSGLVEVADSIDAKLAALDASPLVFDLAGTATAIAPAGTIESLADGAWTGDASWAGSSIPFAAATFSGNRM